jgi:hypothetical protein
MLHAGRPAVNNGKRKPENGENGPRFPVGQMRLCCDEREKPLQAGSLLRLANKKIAGEPAIS